jgi:hypothetical protein
LFYHPIIFGEEYISWSSSFCSFLHCPVTFCLYVYQHRTIAHVLPPSSRDQFSHHRHRLAGSSVLARPISCKTGFEDRVVAETPRISACINVALIS